jgi:hypothetical protein
MSIFKIPFVNNNQKFNITLSGKNLLVTCVWNQEMPAWVVSVQDAASLDFLISGVALVTGVNLFSQFYYTGITGALVVYTKGSPDEIPTFNSLGNESQVFYITGPI